MYSADPRSQATLASATATGSAANTGNHPSSCQSTKSGSGGWRSTSCHLTRANTHGNRPKPPPRPADADGASHILFDTMLTGLPNRYHWLRRDDGHMNGHAGPAQEQTLGTDAKEGRPGGLW
jgi:hypothetical protein